MNRKVEAILTDIQALSREEKIDLLRRLLAELDGPSDPDVERAWLETAHRRYREIVDGKVEGVPGPLVFARLRTRLGG